MYFATTFIEEITQGLEGEIDYEEALFSSWWTTCTKNMRCGVVISATGRLTGMRYRLTLTPFTCVCVPVENFQLYEGVQNQSESPVSVHEQQDSPACNIQPGFC